MPGKRIVITLTQQLDQFLQQVVAETGIDRSNLVRMWIWEQHQKDRDRQIAEKQANADSKRNPR
jgi:metal-responsive CopG/Arc/MetJ family transcriptional regulator